MKYLTLILLLFSSATSFTLTFTSYRSTLDRRKCLELKAQPKQKKKPPTNKNVDMDHLLSGMGLRIATNMKEKSNPPKLSERSSTIRTETIDISTQLNYARNGHAVLRGFIPPSVTNLAEIRKAVLSVAKDKEFLAWKQKVLVASDDKELADSCQSISDCRRELQRLLGSNTGDDNELSLPFLQYFNTWRTIPQVKDLAFSLGQVASILMDVSSVRLYQDAVFWKRRNDGPTPWHVDARMAPFDTSHVITFWIPLQNIDKDGTALIFCSKSHADFALPYWNPLPSSDNNDAESEWDRLQDRYPKRMVDYMPMALGDVTVHSGWTLHCSNGNNNNNANGDDRVALAITFVDGNAEIRPDWKTAGDNEDSWSYQEWCKDVKPRTKFTHELVPIVWPAK